MTNQEVRRLSRVQMLTLLCQQEEEINKLNSLNTDLNKKIKSLTAQIEKTGSFAESAQKAIQSMQDTACINLENAKELEAEKRRAAEKIMRDAENYAKKVYNNGNRYNATITALVREEVRKMSRLFEWQRSQLNNNFIEFKNVMSNLGLAELPSEEVVDGGHISSGDNNCFYEDETVETAEYDCLEYQDRNVRLTPY